MTLVAFLSSFIPPLPQAHAADATGDSYTKSCSPFVSGDSCEFRNAGTGSTGVVAQECQKTCRLKQVDQSTGVEIGLFYASAGLCTVGCGIGIRDEIAYTLLLNSLRNLKAEADSVSAWLTLGAAAGIGCATTILAIPKPEPISKIQALAISTLAISFQRDSVIIQSAARELSDRIASVMRKKSVESAEGDSEILKELSTKVSASLNAASTRNDLGDKLFKDVLGKYDLQARTGEKSNQELQDVSAELEFLVRKGGVKVTSEFADVSATDEVKVNAGILDQLEDVLDSRLLGSLAGMSETLKMKFDLGKPALKWVLSEAGNKSVLEIAGMVDDATKDGASALIGGIVSMDRMRKIMDLNPDACAGWSGMIAKPESIASKKAEAQGTARYAQEIKTLKPIAESISGILSTIKHAKSGGSEVNNGGANAIFELSKKTPTDVGGTSAFGAVESTLSAIAKLPLAYPKPSLLAKTREQLAKRWAAKMKWEKLRNISGKACAASTIGAQAYGFGKAMLAKKDAEKQGSQILKTLGTAALPLILGGGTGGAGGQMLQSVTGIFKKKSIQTDSLEGLFGRKDIKGTLMACGAAAGNMVFALQRTKTRKKSQKAFETSVDLLEQTITASSNKQIADAQVAYQARVNSTGSGHHALAPAAQGTSYGAAQAGKETGSGNASGAGLKTAAGGPTGKGATMFSAATACSGTSCLSPLNPVGNALITSAGFNAAVGPMLAGSNMASIARLASESPGAAMAAMMGVANTSAGREIESGFNAAVEGSSQMLASDSPGGISAISFPSFAAPSGGGMGAIPIGEPFDSGLGDLMGADSRDPSSVPDIQLSAEELGANGKLQGDFETIGKLSQDQVTRDQGLSIFSRISYRYVQQLKKWKTSAKVTSAKE